MLRGDMADGRFWRRARESVHRRGHLSLLFGAPWALGPTLHGNPQVQAKYNPVSYRWPEALKESKGKSVYLWFSEVNVMGKGDIACDLRRENAG